MFTGIVTDLGRIKFIERRGGDRMAIASAYDLATIALGASIACAGVCLTVVDKGTDWFAVDVSAETLARTTLGDYRSGQAINLERSLRVGDELGGHLVSGHVDGVIAVLDRRPDGDSSRLEFELPDWLRRFVATKGSIALDGVSLTVNDVAERSFAVNIVPHTLAATTFGGARPGLRVNAEIDLIARYLARLLGDRNRGREAA